MPSEPRSGGARAEDAAQPTLESVLEEYLGQLADGETPDQESYLARHPHLAEALRGVFKTLDFVEATARSLDSGRLDRGQQLGEFQIVREIARGGMGVVYEAVQTSLGRRVALKVLPAGRLLSGNALERFSREAATAGRLHHTGIVPVYAVGEEQGVHFYAMQLIEGWSLAEHVKTLAKERKRPDREHARRVAHWGRQVAEALAYAHGKGVIHRDVKPSNLLVDGQENVWVTDFGLARADTQATITMSGDMVGTARYMAPEQTGGRGSRADEQSDIYSLGATLYELLALAPAFDGDSREEVLNLIATSSPRPLRTLSPSVPRDLETIVGKCMRRDPAERYASAAVLAEDLRRFLAGEPIRARRPSLLRLAWRFVRRHRVSSVLAAFIAVLAALTVLLVVNGRREHGRALLQQAYAEIVFEGDFGRATELLDQAETLLAATPELPLYRALIPVLNRQSRAAIAPLNQALARSPDHAETRLALAFAQVLSGDHFNGKRLLAQIPEQDITTALGWYLHGLVISMTQHSSALDSFDRAVSLSPGFVPAIAERAFFRGLRLQTEGAREELDLMLNDLDAVVVFRPDSSRSYTWRARGWLSAAAYAATQDDLRGHHQEWLENCRADLERAVALRRASDVLAFHWFGEYHRFTGDFAAARDAFVLAIAADAAVSGRPDPSLAHKHSMALYALGDPAAALAEIEPLRAEEPTFYPLLLERALLLAELGRLDEARAACQEAIVAQSRNTTALFLSCSVMELLRGTEAAQEALRGLAHDDPGDVVSEHADRGAAAPALDFLLGRTDAAAMLEHARSLPGMRCEFAFLAAMRSIARGERAAGLSLLRDCVASGIFRFAEHRFAQAILARVAADERWPAWL